MKTDEELTTPRLHQAAALTIDDTTCVPCVHRQRMDLQWIVDLLCEADPQLRALDAPPEADPRPPARDAPPESVPEPLAGGAAPRPTAAQAA